MSESQTHHRFALSPRATPTRVLAVALAAAAFAPAVAAAQPADNGPVDARAPQAQTVLTGIASIQHRSSAAQQVPDGLAGAPQARGHDTSSLPALRPQVVAVQDLRAPDQAAPVAVVQDLRAPDQAAPGAVVQDQRAPDQVAPATPVAHTTTGDGGLDTGWIVLIAGAGVLLAAGIGLAGRHTRQTRAIRGRSIA